MEKEVIKLHELKLQKEFCQDVYDGRKTFEVRLNDRGFQRGDFVKFLPMDGSFNFPHEVQNKLYKITYVLSGWGIKKNYVVFGIKEAEHIKGDC